MSMAKIDGGERMHSLAREVLERLPPGPRQVLWLGAIPTAFTVRLMEQMTGVEISVPAAIRLLEEFDLLTSLPGGWHTIKAELRAALQDDWRQPAHRAELLAANRIALGYFIELAAQTSPPASYTFQREVLYHSLLQDERDGLETLARLFEEAIDSHQSGAAQDYTTRLAETLAWLSPLAAGYEKYFQARLAFRRAPRLALELDRLKLIQQTGDALLVARADVLMGQWMMAHYCWKDAVAILKTSVKELKRLKASDDLARAMLALGDVYRDLVENSGGVQPAGRPRLSGLQHILNLMIFLPYRVLAWLRRKLSFFPTSLALSGDYQEWIFNYLLRKAGGWYQKAWRVARSSGYEAARLEASIDQAFVAVDLRREARARRLLSRLGKQPAVAASRYRTAQTLLGLGQVALQAGKVELARQQLSTALETFRLFEDAEMVGPTARSLGKASLRLGRPESAGQFYLESIEAYGRIGDPLSQTLVSGDLEDLLSQEDLPAEVISQAETALAANPQRQYLARFSDELLGRVRKIAYLLVLPLAAPIVLILGMAVVLIMLVIEHIALTNFGALSPGDIAWLMALALLPLPLTLWTVLLVYSVLGQLWVPVVGRRSLDTLGEQPKLITLSAEGFRIAPTPSSEPDEPTERKDHPVEPRDLPWGEFKLVLSTDYRLWRQPIQLLSRQYLVGVGEPVVLEGITSGYGRIKRVLQQRGNQAAEHVDRNLTILANRWVLFITIASLVYAVFQFSQGQAYMTTCYVKTGELIRLTVSPILSLWIINLLILLPPVVLWQVYAQRRSISRLIGHRPRILGHGLLLSVAILFSVIAILWLVVSPAMKIGDPRPVDECQAASSGFYEADALFMSELGYISEGQIAEGDLYPLNPRS